MIKVQKANTPEYKSYVSRQIDAWKHHIYCQEMGNDSYYPSDRQKEDDVQLKSWQQEMRELIEAGVEFQDIYEHKNSFILTSKPDFETSQLEIRNIGKTTQAIFYKSIKVKDDNMPCVRQYNIKSGLDLTEDRTAKYQFQINEAVANGIVQLHDVNEIESIVTAPKETYEGQLTYSISARPSQAFLETCKRLAQSQTLKANQSAIAYAMKFLDVSTAPEEFVPSEFEMNQLERAEELLNQAGFFVNQYPRKYVKTLGEGVLARALNGTCYIAKPAFLKGTRLLAHALLEETWHLEHGFEDETRAFQTFLFDNVLNLIERVNNEPF